MAIQGKKVSELDDSTKSAFHNLLFNTGNQIVVQVTDSGKTNGTNLNAAYAAAKLLTPNGSALSATNRACVIVPPGKYDLDHGEGFACVPLTLDAEYVDIIGLTTDRSLQHIFGTPPLENSGVIVQTANDVRISNLTVEILSRVYDDGEGSYGFHYNETDSAAYFPETSLNSTVIENCNFIGGLGNALLWSMRIGAIEYSGTYTKCKSARNSFMNTASGIFIDCDVHSGFGNVASGTFRNCIAASSAFGAYGTASGNFINCTSGSSSFGANGTASGNFTNCTSNFSSFGSSGAASGNFINCKASGNSFGTYGVASGTFVNCISDSSSFGAFGIASGNFTNCIGGGYSFGGSGVASGSFYNCLGANSSFGGGESGVASGNFTLCKGKEGSFNNLTLNVSLLSVIGINNGGTGYSVDDVLTVVGGTGTAATLKVATVSYGQITSLEIVYVGLYTVPPSYNVEVTGGTGNGANLSVICAEGHICACVNDTTFISEKHYND